MTEVAFDRNSFTITKKETTAITCQKGTVLCFTFEIKKTEMFVSSSFTMMLWTFSAFFSKSLLAEICEHLFYFYHDTEQCTSFTHDLWQPTTALSTGRTLPLPLPISFQLLHASERNADIGNCKRPSITAQFLNTAKEPAREQTVQEKPLGTLFVLLGIECVTPASEEGVGCDVPAVEAHTQCSSTFASLRKYFTKASAALNLCFTEITLR